MAEAEEHIKTLLDQPEADKFAILLRPTSSLTTEKPMMIGLIGTKQVPELTFTIHSEFANQGYMTEALHAFVGSKGFYWELPSTCLSSSL